MGNLNCVVKIKRLKKCVDIIKKILKKCVGEECDKGKGWTKKSVIISKD